MVDDYRAWYKSQSFLWRMWNLARWRMGNLIAAIFGGLSPGERFLLKAYKFEQERQLELAMVNHRRDNILSNPTTYLKR